MRYIITRVIIQKSRPGSFVSPLIPVETQPRLGLLTYLRLDGVKDKEVPFFEKLARDRQIVLCKLRHLNSAPERRREEYRTFQAFWETALDVAHFACHASFEDKEPSHSYILLSDEYPVRLRDLEVYGITISSHPLIIMNACETGNLSPLYTAHFAREFLKHGARGVVATECAVPDAFAADFAEQFYAHLLAGEELGTSLLTVRRYFLDKYQNPTGLLYSMYASPAIRLVPTGEQNE